MPGPRFSGGAGHGGRGAGGFCRLSLLCQTQRLGQDCVHVFCFVLVVRFWNTLVGRGGLRSCGKIASGEGFDI